MKLASTRAALLAVAVAVAAALAGCASSAHPRKGERSRASCERALHHYVELQAAAAARAGEDAPQQAELDWPRLETEIKSHPSFLETCNAFSDQQFACMARAKDLPSYDACSS
jgi:hypothetical protein